MLLDKTVNNTSRRRFSTILRKKKYKIINHDIFCLSKAYLRAGFMSLPKYSNRDNSRKIYGDGLPLFVEFPPAKSDLCVCGSRKIRHFLSFIKFF